MNYTDDIALLANTLAHARSLLHSLERTAGGIGLHINVDKIEYMCFYKNQATKWFLETCVQIHLPPKQHLIYRKWPQQAIGHVEVRPIRKNKTLFFPSRGCVHTIIWMHHMDADQAFREKKKLNCTCIKMQRSIRNKFWKQNPTKQQL